MSKLKIEQRIEALEKRSPTEGKPWLVIMRPDGTYSGPEPGEVGEHDVFLIIHGVEALEGRPMTEKELDAKYPERRERIDAFNRAWHGRLVFDAA